MGASSLEEAVGHDCRRGPESIGPLRDATKFAAPADNGTVIDMSRERFEELVADALDDGAGRAGGADGQLRGAGRGRPAGRTTRTCSGCTTARR